MSQIATLLITADGVEYSYDDARFADDALALSVRLARGQRTTESVDLVVFSPTMLGADWAGALPLGRHRASLMLGGTAVFNGTVSATDIAHGRAYALRANERRWSLRLADTALVDALDRLDAIRVDTLAMREADVRITTAYLAETGAQLVYCHALLGLVASNAQAASTGAVGVTLDVPVTLFDLHVGVRVGGAGGTLVVSPTLYLLDYDEEAGLVDQPATLPRLSGRELLELVQALAGGRIDASFAAYPSTDITLTMRPGIWREIDEAETAALPDLGEILDDVDVSVESAEDHDLAVVFEGDLAISAHALYASERWDLRRTVEGADVTVEVGNDSVLEIPARTTIYGTSAWTAEERTVATGAGDVTETISFGWLDLRGGAGLYLLSGWADGPVNVRPIESRSAVEATPGEYFELWAAAIYPRHAHLGSERLVATADVHVDELPAVPVVGEVATQFEGRAWRADATALDLDTGALSLTLSRPARMLPEVLLPQKLVPEVSAFFFDGAFFGGSPGIYFAVIALTPRGSFPGLTESEVSLDLGVTWQGDAGEVTAPGTRVDYRARTLFLDGTASAYVSGFAVGGP